MAAQKNKKDVKNEDSFGIDDDFDLDDILKEIENSDNNNDSDAEDEDDENKRNKLSNGIKENLKNKLLKKEKKIQC